MGSADGFEPAPVVSFSPTALLISASSSGASSSQSSRVVVSPSPVTDFDAAARSYPEGLAVASTKHGVVTDVTVSPVHVGLDSAAAPKIKTKTAPRPGQA